MPRTRFLLILGLLAAGATLTALGTADRNVTLSSLLDLWSDALRNTDQIGMRLTRVSDEEEMRIGADLAREIIVSSLPDPAADAYIADVAQSLLPDVQRRGIRYQFHVIDSPAINAFALPGGQVFVMTGMLNFVQSEAELAAVLGHEISHVDLRHCIERYQYEIKLKKIGAPEVGAMVEFAHRIATSGFSRYQELDADAQGERLSIEARYDPGAGAALFTRMKAQFHEPDREQQTTPVGEVTQATGEALAAYFRTHPPSDERARKLNEMVAGKSGEYYMGTGNLHERVAMSQRRYPEEMRKF
jgi:predicted Zn-dependent protease